MPSETPLARYLKVRFDLEVALGIAQLEAYLAEVTAQ